MQNEYKCQICGSPFPVETQGIKMWEVSRDFEPNPVCWHKDYGVTDDGYSIVFNLGWYTDPIEEEWWVQNGVGLYETELLCLFACQKLEWEHLEKHKKHIKELQERTRASNV